MQVISNERIIFFDVDDTLVLYPTDEPKTALRFVVDPYDQKIVKRVPHLPHIKLLRNYKARGAFVVVWSKNGVRWAQAVVEALGLVRQVDLVMCKPTAFVDDQPAKSWMGERVFIPSINGFGQEG